MSGKELFDKDRAEMLAQPFLDYIEQAGQKLDEATAQLDACAERERKCDEREGVCERVETAQHKREEKLVQREQIVAQAEDTHKVLSLMKVAADRKGEIATLRQNQAQLITERDAEREKVRKLEARIAHLETIAVVLPRA